MNSPQENAIGVVFKLTVKEDGVIVDINSATTKQMIFTKADGVVLTKTASFLTDGTDGVLKYVSIAGDLTPAGDWQVQGRLVLPAGFDGKTSIVEFSVLGNL